MPAWNASAPVSCRGPSFKEGRRQTTTLSLTTAADPTPPFLTRSVTLHVLPTLGRRAVALDSYRYTMTQATRTKLFHQALDLQAITSTLAATTVPTTVQSRWTSGPRARSLARRIAVDSAMLTLYEIPTTSAPATIAAAVQSFRAATKPLRRTAIDFATELMALCKLHSFHLRRLTIQDFPMSSCAANRPAAEVQGHAVATTLSPSISTL